MIETAFTVLTGFIGLGLGLFVLDAITLGREKIITEIV